MSLSYPTWLPGKVQKYKTLFFNSSEILRIFFFFNQIFFNPPAHVPKLPKITLGLAQFVTVNVCEDEKENIEVLSDIVVENNDENQKKELL